jgi:Arc/MetJ family transcription regulator
LDTLTELVRELSSEFPAIATDELREHCARAMKQLGGSVPSTALPEMLNRLVRIRLTAELRQHTEAASG